MPTNGPQHLIPPVPKVWLPPPGPGAAASDGLSSTGAAAVLLYLTCTAVYLLPTFPLLPPFPSIPVAGPPDTWLPLSLCLLTLAASESTLALSCPSFSGILARVSASKSCGVVRWLEARHSMVSWAFATLATSSGSCGCGCGWGLDCL